MSKGSRFQTASLPLSVAISITRLVTPTKHMAPESELGAVKRRHQGTISGWHTLPAGFSGTLIPSFAALETAGYSTLSFSRSTGDPLTVNGRVLFQKSHGTFRLIHPMSTRLVPAGFMQLTSRTLLSRLSCFRRGAKVTQEFQPYFRLRDRFARRSLCRGTAVRHQSHQRFHALIGPKSLFRPDFAPPHSLYG